jgi:tetratricopeptide (TPR) repeat protein
MKLMHALISVIAVAFIFVTPLRADGALDGFKKDFASLEAYIKTQEAGLKTNPMAGIAMIRGIIGKLQALKTDGLPADLKQGFTEFVVAISKMGELFKGWPEKAEEMQAFIVKKIGEDPKYMDNFGKRMAVLEKDMQPTVTKLDELGRKYGLDTSKLAPAIAQQNDDVARCNNTGKQFSNDQIIAACTALIASGRLEGSNLGTAFGQRGVAYALRKEQFDRADWNRALDDWTQAIRLNPKNNAMLNNRCEARAKLGLVAEALVDCDASLQILPNDDDALKNRGFTYLKLGQIDRAISDYDAALKQNPKLAEALYGRGLAKQKKSVGAGNADMAAAKVIQADIAEEFAKYELK